MDVDTIMPSDQRDRASVPAFKQLPDFYDASRDPSDFFPHIGQILRDPSDFSPHIGHIPFENRHICLNA